MLETLGLKTSQFVNIMGDKQETEHDKLMVQTEVKKHIQNIIELLKEGRRKKEITDEETINHLKALQRMRINKEPTSISEFYDKMEE